MAEENDDSQKTEEPTQKRLDDAHKKGQIASSREINHWFMILAATFAAFVFGPGTVEGIARALFVFVEAPHAMRMDPRGIDAWVTDLLQSTGVALLPVAMVFVIAALGAGFVQAGFVLSSEPIRPKLDKISPLRGLKRQFSLQAIMEFVKGLAKLAVVGTIAWMVVRPEFDRIERFSSFEMAEVLSVTYALSLKLLASIAAVMTAIAALDFLYQKLSHLRRLRMTREELRDEYKESDGDPLIKGRLKQIRMERARRRMMQAVPTADVVITNPTHYAVALKYDQATMSAPKVVAKGTDLVARRIRQLAEENKVPIVENPPLARALHASVEIDQEIPPDHYKAVAEVIGFVMRLRRGRGRPNG